MSFTYSLVLFFVFILIYLLIIEIFTVLFRLTGMTYDKAHLQVISMLTSCGFTTQESEGITMFRTRRKLAKLTIVFGYLFTVVIMSSVINVFLSLNQVDVANMWQSVVVILVSVGLITISIRVRAVRHFLDARIEILGNRIMFGDSSNAIVLLDMYGKNAMCEISLSNLPTQFHSVPLKNSGLKERYKIQLILIKRNGVTLSIMNGEDVLLPNDTIVVFGDYTNIKALFKKPTAVTA